MRLSGRLSFELGEAPEPLYRLATSQHEIAVENLQRNGIDHLIRACEGIENKARVRASRDREERKIREELKKRRSV
jgi:hypothetical protein